ncbi:MAG TPA: dockerin type 1 [Bacteroidales bacterium]|nr:dockerin type 1 [Bacteroidales bacterium]
MIKRDLNYLLIAILIMALFAACAKNDDNSGDDNNNDTDVYTYDTTTVVQVNLNGSSINVIPDVATVSGGKVTLISAGTYKITGSLTEGQIVVNANNKGNVRLILNGVNIKCSSGAPIYIKDADKAILNLADGTVNTLTDGSIYITDSSGEPNAALFSDADLVIYGEGSLNVNANYNDGISSDDGLVVKSGTITVKAADDGIRGKDFLIIQDGNITVNSVGDALKSDNETDSSKGYITIEGGTLNLTATAGDAIDAVSNLIVNGGIFNIKTGTGAGTSTGGTGQPGGGSGGYSGTISEKGLKGAVSVKIEKGSFTINSADDAIHSNGTITMDDGNISVATGDDAIHSEISVTINGGTLAVTKSFEAIESASITVNKGNLNLVATNDGFNATKGSGGESGDGSLLTFNDGYAVVNVSSGDGLDSNGNIVMSGGTVIVHGPQSAPEVAFDFNGTFIISGGILVAGGPNSGNMIEVPGSGSSQCCIKATGSSIISASTLIHIQDASGNDVVTFKPVRNTYYFVFSSSQLATGASYSIYTGGSSTGIQTDGLYSGGTYSGGTFKKTFTISGKITSVTF